MVFGGVTLFFGILVLMDWLGSRRDHPRSSAPNRRRRAVVLTYFLHGLYSREVYCSFRDPLSNSGR